MTYDVVVVGGGAAGLSGALALGRARRSVLVIDGGENRNAAAGRVHNYLGREGASPAELMAAGRAEVKRYDVQVHAGAVATASTREGGFTVQLADGSEVTARRLLLATGANDELPDLPGLAEGWGSTVLHCPYCHGWEMRDQPIGVVSTLPLGVHAVLLWRQWTEDLTLFTHTGPAPTGDEREQLQARCIRVVEGTIAAWDGDAVLMADGTRHPLGGLVATSFVPARVPDGLGLRVEDVAMGGHVVGTQVLTDATGLTSVPGVWAAGNVTDVRAQVIGSAAAGLLAAGALNADLIAEDTRLAVEIARYFSQPAWEDRYSARDGAIWSGNPNAVLVIEAADLTPGRALDVGCGEGADALWLADRGWEVTGTDLSTVALQRAAGHDAHGRVRWQHVDLLANPPAPQSFELVTAHFMHLPRADRITLYAHLAEAVVPGGTLLLVAHSAVDARHPQGRNVPGMFFTAPDLVAELDLDRWQVQVAEERPRPWTNPDGVAGTIHDTVLRAVRTS